MGDQIDPAQLSLVEASSVAGAGPLQGLRDRPLRRQGRRPDPRVRSSFGADARGQEVDFDLEARIADVNEPQTIGGAAERPAAQRAAAEPSASTLGAGPGARARHRSAPAARRLPQAGGSPTAPSAGATQAYLECLSRPRAPPRCRRARRCSSRAPSPGRIGFPVAPGQRGSQPTSSDRGSCSARAAGPTCWSRSSRWRSRSSWPTPRPAWSSSPPPLGVIPTAALMGRATEEVAARSGPGDRRPAQRHLRQRSRADHRPVRARGGPARGGQGLDHRLDPGQHPAGDGRGDARRRARRRARQVQKFDRTAANVQSLMLLLAAAAMVMPAIFELVEGKGLPRDRPGARRLRRHGRAPLAGGRARPDRHLRRRALSSASGPTASSSTRTRRRRGADDTWGWSVRSR